jgi:hypothetical protein
MKPMRFGWVMTCVSYFNAEKAVGVRK